MDPKFPDHLGDEEYPQIRKIIITDNTIPYISNNPEGKQTVNALKKLKELGVELHYIATEQVTPEESAQDPITQKRDWTKKHIKHIREHNLDPDLFNITITEPDTVKTEHHKTGNLRNPLKVAEFAKEISGDNPRQTLIIADGQDVYTLKDSGFPIKNTLGNTSVRLYGEITGKSQDTLLEPEPRDTAQKTRPSQTHEPKTDKHQTTTRQNTSTELARDPVTLERDNPLADKAKPLPGKDNAGLGSIQLEPPKSDIDVTPTIIVPEELVFETDFQKNTSFALREGAKEGLKAMKDAGYDVLLVSTKAAEPGRFGKADKKLGSTLRYIKESMPSTNPREIEDRKQTLSSISGALKFRGGDDLVDNMTQTLEGAVQNSGIAKDGMSFAGRSKTSMIFLDTGKNTPKDWLEQNNIKRIDAKNTTLNEIAQNQLGLQLQEPQQQERRRKRPARRH